MFTLLSFSIRYRFLYTFWQRLIHHVNYLKGAKSSYLRLWFISLTFTTFGHMRGMRYKAKKKCTILLFLAGGEELETLLAIAFTLQTVFIPGTYPQSTKKIRKV